MAEALQDAEHAERWLATAERMADSFTRLHVVRSHESVNAIVADVYYPSSDGHDGYGQAGQVGPLLDGLTDGQEARELIDFAFPDPVGSPLAANDIGEMLFFAMVGAIWLAGLVSALFSARPKAAVHSLYIAAGIGMAAVFGVFVDMFTSWGVHSVAQTDFRAWLEDGGEFAFINLTFLMVVAFFDAEKRKWQAAAEAPRAPALALAA